MRDYSDSEFPWVHIETFGFDHGVPQTVTGCLLVDLRGIDIDSDNRLQNGRTGKDRDVIKHVMASRTLLSKVEQAAGQTKALLEFNSQKNFTVRVLIGDHDGRARAVVVGDAVADVLNNCGIPTEVNHHHLVTSVQK